MSTEITALQIVDRLKSELLPHRVEAKIYDYGEKFDLKVWCAPSPTLPHRQ